MNEKLKSKIKEIPHSPGCYKYFNKKGELIYIGKAKDLKKRVSSYFSGENDIKTTVLVENIKNIKWEVTDSEIEALILESLLIKKYKPKFNIKIKDDKDFLWVKIDMGADFPMPELVRPFFAKASKGKPSSGKIKYFGPYTDSRLLKQGLAVLRKIFLWRDCSASKFSFYKKKGKPCLEYYIKNCSAPCMIGSNDYQQVVVINKQSLSNSKDSYSAKASKDEYLLNIKQLISFLSGKKKSIVKEFERAMNKYAKEKNFEEALKYRDKLKGLQHVDASFKFQNPNDKLQTNSKFQISNGGQYLKSFVEAINKDLDYRIKYKDDLRIEFYDISNTSGDEAVGSMVVWQGSKFAKDQYKKFKIKLVKGPNDVEMMREVLFRRSKYLNNPKDHKNLKDPDLIVLDGGKPQLGGAHKLFESLKINIPLISLAKKEEEIWGINNKFQKVNIKKDSPEGFFIQRLRDEAHRFAIGYHKVLREKKIIRSRLDEIEGVGPILKKKLLLKFGSVGGIMEADIGELKKIVGGVLACRIKERL